MDTGRNAMNHPPSTATPCRLLLYLSLMVHATIVTPSLAADPPPAPEALRQQAQRCRQILQTSLIDFYLPACVDRANGGYFESLRDGQFAATGEKFLTQQGRQLWFFSTLAGEGIQKEAALAAAKSGF